MLCIRIVENAPRARTGERSETMTALRTLRNKWMKNASFKKAYDDLEVEDATIRVCIEARDKAGLTQTDVAERMGTTQPVVARLERGRQAPSLATRSAMRRPWERACGFNSYERKEAPSDGQGSTRTARARGRFGRASAS
jgi:ribosome-binding protein aMBF1 (putative translation factor)